MKKITDTDRLTWLAGQKVTIWWRQGKPATEWWARDIECIRATLDEVIGNYRK